MYAHTFLQATHFIKHLCQRKGRPGLALAIDKLVMELTLLGFVSLLLTTFSKPLDRTCVGYSDTMADWTIISNIQGCPCCLEETDGVSLCAQMAKECLFNSTSRTPYCDCQVTGSEAYAESDLPYKEHLAMGQVDEACKPYEMAEVEYFLEVAFNSMVALADDFLLGNISADPVGEICSLVEEYYAKANSAEEDYPTFISPDEPLQGRRRLLASSGAHEADTNDPLGSIIANLNWKYNGSNNGSIAGNTTIHTLPRVRQFKCTGPFPSSQCPAGKVVLISSNALHQVHIWLFLIAIFHVAISGYHIIFAELLVRFVWRRWERQAQQLDAKGGEGAWVLLLARSTMLAGRTGPKGGAIADNGTSVGIDDISSSEIKRLSREGSDVAAQGAPSDMEVGGATTACPAVSAALPAAMPVVEPLGPAASLAPQAQAEPQPCKPAAPVGDRGAWAAVGAAISNGTRQLKRRWRFRTAHTPHAQGLAFEAALCLLQALSPFIVTRSKFLIMRAAWLASLPTSRKHVLAAGLEAAAADAPTAFPAGAGKAAEPAPLPLPAGGDQQLQLSGSGKPGGQNEPAGLPIPPGGSHSTSSSIRLKSSVLLGGAHAEAAVAAAVGGQGGSPEFVRHVLHRMDQELPTFVGLSLEMSGVIVLMLLLMGAIGWARSLIMIIAFALLLCTNIALVSLLRHKSRGGRPHPAKHQHIKWWRNPHLLLGIPIRLLLFLASFVYSTTAFFAWQFGANSCFFHPDSDPWGILSLHYWVGLAAASILLAWMSVATIPAFALAVHAHHQRALDSETHIHSSTNGAAHGPTGTPQLPPSWWPGASGSQGGGSAAAEQEGLGTAAAAEALKAENDRLRSRVAELEASLTSQAAEGPAAVAPAPPV